jgi:hypothetical protein
MHNYNSLPDRTIRLLTLHPGQYDDPLVAELSDASLDDLPTYEAFSYLWGPPNFTARIQLVGADADFMITESLAGGLRQFRHVSEKRTLWIDQISINQQDIDERSAQVKFMGEIYEHAACVLLWLGQDAGGNAPLANTIVQQILQIRTMTADVKHHQRLEQYGRGDWTHTSGEPSITSFLDTLSTMTKESAALKHLVELPYWERAWILQEVRLARAKLAMWGTTEIDLEALRSTAQWLLLSESQQIIAGSRMLVNSLHLTVTCLNPAGGRPFDSMERGLAYLHLRSATNPRDKVYAFLDLLEDRKAAASFKDLVDYRKSVLQVHVDAATAAMHESGLNILSTTNLNHAVLAAMEKEGWPSWVPDLKIRPGPVPLTGYCSFATACHSETDDRLTKVKIVEHPTVNNHYSFTTVGLIIDSISAVSPFCNVSETFTNIPRPTDLYAYISAAWRIACGSVSVADFVQAIICSNGSFWEETGDLTETNEGGFQSPLTLWGIGKYRAAREASIKLHVIKSYTYLAFAFVLMSGPDGFSARLENTTGSADESFDVKTDIQLIDGLIEQRHALLQEAEQSEMRMIVAEYNLSSEEEEGCLDGVPRPAQRRQARLEEFKREHSETYHQLRDGFEEQLEPYYPNQEDREKAISALLIAVHEPTDLTVAKVEPFFSRFGRVTSNRRFFLTTDGRPGMGPNCLEQNDVVAILAGGSVPFVLRPVSGGYRFVGECYVGDLMKGGGLDGRTDLPLDTIRLQ